MSVEILARIQFAFTVGFHYIYPPLSIGLGVVMVIVEGLWLKTGNPVYKTAAKFWTKVFGLTFAIGVATGIVMEFEFGTNWSTYSRYVGDVFGSALAAEGIFAFFLESGFLALLLFGWDRVGPKLHFFAALMVCLGAHFSAVWIVVANSWQQTPAGYHVVGHGLDARAEITDFWAMVFNPSSMDRLVHVVLGCWMAGAFLVLSISAFYILRKRHLEIARPSFKIGLCVALVASLAQALSGHSSAQVVARHQSAKLAAMEGHYETREGAPLYLMGWVDTENERVRGIGVPGMLSFLAWNDPQAEVVGLDQFSKEDRPPVQITFQAFHAMVGIGVALIALSLAGAFAWWKGWLFESRWLMRLFVLSVLGPQFANQLGWITAEVGRQPWIVYGLLRTSDGLSKVVTANHIVASLVMFTLIYLMLFALFVFLLHQKIMHGPDEIEKAVPSSKRERLPLLEKS